MMNSAITWGYRCVLCAVSVWCMIPSSALGAQATFSVVSNETRGDRAAIIEVYIDPEGAELNAVEGIIKIEEGIPGTLVSVVPETGGSLLTLWPSPPVYTPEDQTIRFVGGVPNGFSAGGRLLRFRIFADTSDTLRIFWLNGAAYHNDGVGTKEAVKGGSLVVTLEPSKPNPINPASPDSVPPRFDALEVGQDQSVFDGKYFVSFHAIDDASGIDYYEVSENEVVTRADQGMYVLQDQEREVRVVITAYDKAGNSTAVEVPGRYTSIIHYGIAVLLLGVVLACVFFYLRFKKRRIRIPVRRRY